MSAKEGEHINKRGKCIKNQEPIITCTMKDEASIPLKGVNLIPRKLDNSIVPRKADASVPHKRKADDSSPPSLIASLVRKAKESKLSMPQINHQNNGSFQIGSRNRNRKKSQQVARRNNRANHSSQAGLNNESRLLTQPPQASLHYVPKRNVLEGIEYDPQEFNDLANDGTLRLGPRNGSSWLSETMKRQTLDYPASFAGWVVIFMDVDQIASKHCNMDFDRFRHNAVQLARKEFPNKKIVLIGGIHECHWNRSYYRALLLAPPHSQFWNNVPTSRLFVTEFKPQAVDKALYNIFYDAVEWGKPAGIVVISSDKDYIDMVKRASKEGIKSMVLHHDPKTELQRHPDCSYLIHKFTCTKVAKTK